MSAGRARLSDCDEHVTVFQRGRSVKGDQVVPTPRDHSTTTETVRVWSRDEIAAVLEEQARSRCGMSAVELLRRVRRGDFDDSGEVSDLLSLAYLLSDDDPLLVGA